jgi:hypothetical protein
VKKELRKLLQLFAPNPLHECTGQHMSYSLILAEEGLYLRLVDFRITHLWAESNKEEREEKYSLIVYISAVEHSYMRMTVSQPFTDQGFELQDEKSDTNTPL